MWCGTVSPQCYESSVRVLRSERNVPRVYAAVSREPLSVGPSRPVVPLPGTESIRATHACVAGSPRAQRTGPFSSGRPYGSGPPGT
jgi:hypothetical protein